MTAPDLNGYLCPTGRFRSSLGAVSDRRADGVHVARAVADSVARWLLLVIEAGAPGRNELVAKR